MRMKPDMPAGVQLSRQSRNRGLAGLTNYTFPQTSTSVLILSDFLLVVNFWTPFKAKHIATDRPVARPIIVRFFVFLVDYFSLFLCRRQSQVPKMLPAACHHVLEEVVEKTPNRHASCFIFMKHYCLPCC